MIIEVEHLPATRKDCEKAYDDHVKNLGKNEIVSTKPNFLIR